MTENSENGITEYKLYLEKISSIIHVSPKIGTLIFLAEWYLVYVIVCIMKTSVLFPGIFNIVPGLLIITLGWGLLYVRKIYIRSSKNLKFLLDESTYRELFDKMIRRRLTVIIYVTFCLLGFYALYLGIKEMPSIASWIFVVHMVIWFVVLGWPVFSEFISLIVSVISFPYWISKGIRYDVIMPIEPYRRAGFRPIGELYFSGAFVYFSSLTIYSVLCYVYNFPNGGNMGLLIIAIILWVVGILIFFIPVHFVHKLLRDYKRKMLNKITSQIYEESKMHDLTNGRITERDAISLYTLMFTFTEIEKMHEYPFDLKIWRDFLVIAVIPLIIQIVIVVLLSFDYPDVFQSIPPQIRELVMCNFSNNSVASN